MTAQHFTGQVNTNYTNCKSLVTYLENLFDDRVAKFVKKGILIGGDPNTKEESTCTAADKVLWLFSETCIM
jgi:hypothetical protein